MAENRKKPELPEEAPRSERKKREPAADEIRESPSSRFAHRLIPYVLVVFALFLAACFVSVHLFKAEGAVGIAGEALNDIMCGLFGWPAFILPAIFLHLALFWRRYADMKILPLKIFLSFFGMIAVSALVHVFYVHSGEGNSGFDVRNLWIEGTELHGGGVLGGLSGQGCYSLLNIVGSLILLIAGTGILFMFLVGTTPSAIFLRARYNLKLIDEKIRERKAKKAERKAEKEKNKPEKEKPEKEKPEKEKPEKEKSGKGMRNNPEKREPEEKKDGYDGVKKTGRIDFADLTESNEDPKGVSKGVPAGISEENPGGNPEENPAENPAETQMPAPPEKPKGREEPPDPARDLIKDSDFNDIGDLIRGEQKKKVQNEMPELREIADEEDISGLMETDEEVVDKEEETKYSFPPIEFLYDDKVDIEEDFGDELRENAKRIVSTLADFNVSIKEISYSRGPTITRYELKPDKGVRIRSIANLVNDIALSLATDGVRMEAPVPGKSAVGIEVPNKHKGTVYLRKLIDSPVFYESKSRLTACLGTDVAGKPVYFNIDKMPHLLIAGATNMGKSVCINSIIISLLYKAKPDEVKLILIDPKKVEFNMYKEIPHLYVPVVSDLRKAAGVLATAVAEMERRFELIEQVNVRDISHYNQLAENDPDIDYLPRIVVIIDELADLMMSAPDQVEKSICRLAQKARAAGIHLIIATQRPSVDVITGLIKANIPSRISCKVSSQVDSRIIIDMAGAEKLIGRGDMLFAPVGAMKPLRVQGAFVSDTEVENIVRYIKENNTGVSYDSDFIRKSEEEAANVGNKKRTQIFDDSDDGAIDPKFREALEIAVTAGKVSTSLLQRKIFVGYGRAAKILDQMEERGYVDKADGNKPRKVLITQEQFMEKVINDDI